MVVSQVDTIYYDIIKSFWIIKKTSNELSNLNINTYTENSTKINL